MAGAPEVPVAVRVQVISPLPSVRAGLRALLQSAAGMLVVGESSRVGDADGSPIRRGTDLGATEDTLGPPPDVMVVDALAGDLDDLAEQVSGGRPPWPVILGPAPGIDRVAAAVDGRPWGYVPREATAAQLAVAVRAVAANMVAVDADLGRDLLARLSTLRPSPAVDGDAADGDLTAREREVLQLVAIGLANKQIARRLGISEHTVKFHVAALLTKLGAGSRTEAVHLGARRGLVAL